ncbi:AprI/Inh family metalloprotease inhibitor [Allosphingosinicella deserti]|uniref:Alkaline proteinase inhibitor/ Outer membrane lipoprotein Omp19 domain-containing protein n=1 Tax=Allosphingosinicella deserti TaxID=2116704 RepID=A0A2P7QN90_9SPHN|nr:AprI/Inh family metalloprotease inhibitor [Sphingomonas deserti]PSJ39432.1 hypothetical protein C7I55_12500 [Sphingomonas deserti]
MRGTRVFVALLLATSGAEAQVGDEMIRETAGRWQIIPADGSPACSIVLTATPDGAERWRAQPEPACAARVPASRGVTGWRLADGMVLLDARGRARMTFVEDETAVPTSPDLINPRHYLMPAVAGYTHRLQPAEWAGTWKIMQTGKRSCTITLRQAPPGNGGAAGTVTAACPRGSVPARLERWSLEDLKLILWGKNDLVLAFEPAPHGRWIAEPGAWSLAR